MATKVMIVEDQGLFREMLQVSLSSQPDVQVVGVASDGASAIDLARNVVPQVILMDINLGDGPNGIETGIRIKETNPQVGIVLLSMHNNIEYLRALPPEKAKGWSYLMKQSVGNIATLNRAIQGAAAGWVVLDPELVQSGSHQGNLARLTAKQRTVLDLMAQGYNNAAIAQTLFMGEKAVENHIYSIYQRLDISRDEPIHPRVKAVLLYVAETGANIQHGTGLGPANREV